MADRNGVAVVRKEHLNPRHRTTPRGEVKELDKTSKTRPLLEGRLQPGVRRDTVAKKGLVGKTTDLERQAARIDVKGEEQKRKTRAAAEKEREVHHRRARHEMEGKALATAKDDWDGKGNQREHRRHQSRRRKSDEQPTGALIQEPKPMIKTEINRPGDNFQQPALDEPILPENPSQMDFYVNPVVEGELSEQFKSTNLTSGEATNSVPQPTSANPTYGAFHSKAMFKPPERSKVVNPNQDLVNPTSDAVKTQKDNHQVDSKFGPRRSQDHTLEEEKELKSRVQASRGSDADKNNSIGRTGQAAIDRRAQEREQADAAFKGGRQKPTEVRMSRLQHIQAKSKPKAPHRSEPRNLHVHVSRAQLKNENCARGQVKK